MQGDVSADSGNCLPHFQNCQITTPIGGQLSFELSEMVSGEAQTIFEPFSEAVNDL